MGSFPEMYNAPFKDLIRNGRFYARTTSASIIKTVNKTDASNV